MATTTTPTEDQTMSQTTTTIEAEALDRLESLPNYREAIFDATTYAEREGRTAYVAALSNSTGVICLHVGSLLLDNWDPEPWEGLLVSIDPDGTKHYHLHAC
jgi:hypothetical protein